MKIVSTIILAGSFFFFFVTSNKLFQINRIVQYGNIRKYIPLFVSVGSLSFLVSFLYFARTYFIIVDNHLYTNLENFVKIICLIPVFYSITEFYKSHFRSNTDKAITLFLKALFPFCLLITLSSLLIQNSYQADFPVSLFFCFGLLLLFIAHLFILFLKASVPSNKIYLSLFFLFILIFIFLGLYKYKTAPIRGISWYIYFNFFWNCFHIWVFKRLSPSVMANRDKINLSSLTKFKITNREKEIISLVMTGLSNDEIGEKLFISTTTVKKHLYNIFQKTGVKNRVSLINLFQL